MSTTLPSVASDLDEAELPAPVASPAVSRRLPTPREIRALVPHNARTSGVVQAGRDAFRRILAGEDSRTVIIAGPCSIHDPAEALEYARRLKALSDEVSDRVLLVMRVYFEKPRTNIGWKGLINDPHLDESHAIADGLRIARTLLRDIAELGLPTATELLDPLVAPYLADLVSWVAIGARTTESQIHRQLASGLAAPVGFKNGTDGGLEVAINAVKAARRPHVMLGADDDGHIAALETRGNLATHLVLRGAGHAGDARPNYRREDVAAIEARMQRAGLEPRMLLDCSHANCGYDYRRQGEVVADWIAQRQDGCSESVFGLMLESNIEEGKQPCAPRHRLRPGVSVTDGCIGWTDTERLIRQVYAADL